MRLMRLVLALLLLFSPIAHADARSKAKVYIVIHEVSVDEEGKLVSVKVSKVMDSATRNPGSSVKVSVPESYMAAVRADLATRKYESGKRVFFTYTFFDPTQPSNVHVLPGLR